MTHGRNHRDFRSGDGPDHTLIVKGPQVFHGTPAPAYDQHVRQFVPVEEPDPPDDFRRGFRALDLYGIQPELYGRIPAAGHVDDVPDRCPGRRCDDAHHFGIGRQGTLPAGVEEPFGGEFFLQLLIGDHQVPGSQGHHHVHVELIDPVPFIQVDPAHPQHLVPVFGQLLQAPGRTGEHNGFQQGLAVF